MNIMSTTSEKGSEAVPGEDLSRERSEGSEGFEDQNSLPECLQRDLAELPERPGIYLMHSHSSQILYIGKAKNLQRRVRSYFRGRKDLKTEMLRRKVVHVEVLLCANDYEALILENNLIKKHKPRYNINLKDDKTYPLICISRDEFPRIFKTRQIKRDGSRYFGPYPDGLQLETTLQLLSELFPLRRCKGPLRRRDNPCLYYHMKQCLGPCIGAVSKEDYRSQVQRAKHLLEGSSKTLQQELERDMRRASEALRFEEAAGLRDRLRGLRRLQQDQSVESQERPEVDRDYLAVLQMEDYYFFTVLLLREGKLLGHHHFSSRYLPEGLQAGVQAGLQTETQEKTGPEQAEQTEPAATVSDGDWRRKTAMSSALVEFLCQYYLESGHELPDELHLPELDIEWDGPELFLRLLEEQRGKRFVIRPFRREREAANDRLLLLRARENVIREQQLWLRYQGRGLMLEELRSALDLEELPEHVEGFDISHMDGQATVASLIVFRSGRPAKDEYRSFNLRSTEGRIDDFASIQEAVSRRYTRLLNEGTELPDLIMIDGGQGQVNAAAGVLRSLELSIPLVGLAKREEILFFPAIPYRDGVSDHYSEPRAPLDLPLSHPGLKLLQQLRDETHRWAHGKNRKRYEKRVSVSVLENVPGVGKKRSSTLLQHYGSLEALGEVEPDELAKVAHMGLDVAETLAEYLTRRKQKT
ncbi:excinuclease ABC subunit UvrC [Candidatus Haliotispira prima]|uniref:UvrABC system protein C n=1 Tax=Candidatus Haliotispira prima TaxID=3034016 RepID=A0ABY8MFE7_9SPIO|nr:excinuclease ABC subunit UvrC [Candidatus Haliotispira prima]